MPRNPLLVPEAPRLLLVWQARLSLERQTLPRPLPEAAHRHPDASQNSHRSLTPQSLLLAQSARLCPAHRSLDAAARRRPGAFPSSRPSHIRLSRPPAPSVPRCPAHLSLDEAVLLVLTERQAPTNLGPTTLPVHLRLAARAQFRNTLQVPRVGLLRHTRTPLALSPSRRLPRDHLHPRAPQLHPSLRPRQQATTNSAQARPHDPCRRRVPATHHRVAPI